MKIAVSSDNDQGLQSTVSGHFGHCPFFTILDVEDKKIIRSESIANPYFQGHQPFEIPNFLKEQGINAIITQGMGGRAIGFFQQNDIEPVTGLSGSVEDAVNIYLSGSASSAAPCAESVAHQHGNGEA